VPVKFVADENFKAAIVRGLLRQQPEFGIVRIQDVGLSGADDPTVLEWAAQRKRVLLTHDVQTITKYAYERLVEGLPMPGVIEVRQDAPIGQVIEDILLLSEFEDECEGQIHYVPMR
jgi:predicted nuclease of predicted toxin-antitoxin system